MTRVQDFDALDPNRWRALTAVLVATFMVLLDTSIVNNAIPSIQRDLGSSPAQIQYVLDAYLLAYAALLITGGRLGDMVGRKRVFLLGVGGFALTSGLCGLAPSPELLILFRTLQGLTAALLVPQVSAIIQVSFPQDELGRAFSFFGAVVGLGTVAGPLLGGFLIGADVWGLTWRSIFLVNLPVSIVALLSAGQLVRESRASVSRRLDMGGVALITLALLLLIFPVVEGRALGWPLWIFACLLMSFIVLGLFAANQTSKARRNGSPLLEPALFHDRAFVTGLLINLVFFSGVYSFFLTLSIFLQSGLSLSALQAAFLILPFQSTSLITSLLSARLAKRFGKRVLYAGGVLLTTGVGLIIAALAGSMVSNPPFLLPALLTGGAGFGLIIGPLTTLVLSGVQERLSGVAAGVLSTAQQVGGAVGIAIMGVLLFGQLDAPREGIGAAHGGPSVQNLNTTRPSQVDGFVTATQRTLLFNLTAFGTTIGLFFLIPEAKRVDRSTSKKLSDSR